MILRDMFFVLLALGVLSGLSTAHLPYSREGKKWQLVKGGSFKFQNAATTSLKDFYLSRYELTVEEYDSFCTATGRALLDDGGWGRGKRPAMRVSWHDAIAYCNWRSRRDGLQPCYTIESEDTSGWKVSCDWAAEGYRLPSEAEWEYAARGGNRSRGWEYAGDDHPAAVAWFEGNSGGQTHPVGTRKPNELNLYDMSGNVWEWVWHWHPEDTRNPERLLRGGSWHTNGYNCKTTVRIYDKPQRIDNEYGFRLARSVGR